MSAIPKTLRDSILKGRVIPFVGSGVPLRVLHRDGSQLFPSRRSFLELMVKRLEEEQAPESASLLRPFIDRMEIGEAVRQARRALGVRWKDFMRDVLAPSRTDVDDASLSLARGIWKISDLVVTTNYDQVLEWSHPAPERLAVVDPSGLARTFAQGPAQPLLCHVLGTAENGDSLFSFNYVESDIPDAGHQQRVQVSSRVLQQLFAGPWNVLFIGSNAPLDANRRLFASTDCQHYWIVQEHEQEMLQTKVNDRGLPVQAVGVKDYGLLSAQLEELAHGRSSSLSSDYASNPTSRRQWADLLRELSASEKGVIRPTEQPPPEEETRVLKKSVETATFDVAIICALRLPELQEVLKTGETWSKFRTGPGDPQIYHQGVYTTSAGTRLRVVAAAPNQMGPPAAAALAAKMILQFKPRLMAMVGIAAGVRVDPTGYGDVLAPETTLDYASGKIAAEDGKVSFKPDPKPIHINSGLLSLLNEWRANTHVMVEIWNNWKDDKPARPPSLIIGPLASGASVVANRAIVEDVVLHWRKLIGLEMETYAVHCACRDTAAPETPFLALKSVCDFADGSKHDAWQPYAAYVAAELLHRLLVAEWENLHLPPHSTP